jgi:hypothetical protein
VVDGAASQHRVLGIFRTACVVVAVVAGVAGMVMLVAPDDTDRYFSWPIGPPPLAALVGGFYLASAATFGLLAARRDWPASRGICFGIVAFTLPTLAATVRHHDLFDWGRWQALAWVALFVGSPLAFSSFLYLQRGRRGAGGSPLPDWTRAVLALLGAVYSLLAVGLLFAPGRLQADLSPFRLPGLSGRFIGAWCAFLAVIALFSAGRNRSHEVAFPMLALVLWPVGGIVAAIRSFDDLQPSGRRTVNLLLLGALALAALTASVGRHRLAQPAPVKGEAVL